MCILSISKIQAFYTPTADTGWYSSVILKWKCIMTTYELMNQISSTSFKYILAELLEQSNKQQLINFDYLAHKKENKVTFIISILNVWHQDQHTFNVYMTEKQYFLLNYCWMDKGKYLNVFSAWIWQVGYLFVVLRISERFSSLYVCVVLHSCICSNIFKASGNIFQKWNQS